MSDGERLHRRWPRHFASAYDISKKQKTRPKPGFSSQFARQLLLLGRRLLLRQLELRLRVADRSRGDFLRAHVLEHNQTVLRVFLGQAGAARSDSGDRSNRIRGRDYRGTVDQRARPPDVDAAVM